MIFEGSQLEIFCAFLLEISETKYVEKNTFNFLIQNYPIIFYV